MKKLIGILLYICLLVPFLGVISVYHYQRYQVRKEVKWQMIRGINKADLELVKVSLMEVATTLDWKHDREFEYSGYMYDVVEQEVRGDTVIFYCWPDHSETLLNKKLTAAMSVAMERHPQNKAHQQRLTDFFKSLFSSPAQGNQPDIQVTMIKKDHPQYHRSYASLLFPPPSPPPEAL